MASTIDSDLDINGAVTAQSITAPIARSNLIVETQQVFALPLENFRVWDAYGTLLGTPANDDLGITAGAFATGTPYISSGDVKAAGTTTRRARTTFLVPHNYVTTKTLVITLAAGMLTTVAGTSCTVDVEAYKFDENTLQTFGDFISTAAQSINSMSFANKDFAISLAGEIEPGTVLDIRVTITAVDPATVTAVTAAISNASVRCTTRG